MSARRQLLVWASVVTALSLILISKVRDTSAVANTPELTSSETQVDFATIFTDSSSNINLDPSQRLNTKTSTLLTDPSFPPQQISLLTHTGRKIDPILSDNNRNTSRNIVSSDPGPILKNRISVGRQFKNRVQKSATSSSVIPAQQNEVLLFPSEIEQPKTSTATPPPKPSVSVNTYRIKRNDSLWKIAAKNKVDLYTLLTFNKLKNANLIQKGQTIRIPDTPGILHTVQKNETLEDIALRYQVGLSTVIKANAIIDPDFIQANTDLFLPHATLTNRFRKQLLNKHVNPKFILPARGRISDGYGYRIHPVLKRRRLHKGVDIAAKTGTAVRASARGRVSFSGTMGGYGKLIIIDHVGGYETRYAHNSRLLVKQGQRVRQGQKIALVGNTGLTTGPHLHFEIRKHQKATNPKTYLRLN
jgi:murein DD-endopeptidase MepM/ murein hydrolase activator NlpD